MIEEIVITPQMIILYVLIINLIGFLIMGLDKFKAKNLYDTAGNVWEYTSEYLVNEEGKKQYIARGGNYYWQYDKVVAAGAAVREFISEREGEKNEHGLIFQLL